MVNTLFQAVVEMSITSSIVIVLVVLARFCMKKVPKIFAYGLWAVVLFRLLCPFSFESPVALVPEEVVVEIQAESTTVTMPATMNQDHIVMPQDVETAPLTPVTPAVEPTYEWQDFAVIIWLLGMGLMAVYGLVSYLKLKQKISISLKLWKKVYISDYIESPFVLGLLCPKIYLPSSIEEQERRYVLVHERHHIRRFDHVTRFLAYLALTVHWFNPLVWLAFFLSAKDMELSCDEAVMQKMPHDIRRDYATSILRFATGRPTLSAVGFGESDTKTRVKNVLNYKKPAFWVIIVGVLAVAILAFLLLANPKPEEIPEPEQTVEPAVATMPSFTEVDEPEQESNVALTATSENEFTALSEDDLQVQYFFMRPTYGMGENPSFSTLFAEPDGLERLKNFYGDLTKDFSYMEFHTQFLTYEGSYHGNAKFSDNELVNEEVNGSFHTKLQTFMVGKSVYKMLDNKIDTGTNFEEDDFVVYSDGDIIPLILGAEYNGVYSLGDELTLSLHNQPLRFTVIGFLQGDTTIAMNTPEISLDTRIIMPFFDIEYEPTNEENAFFQQVYYTQKIEGFLQTDNTIEAEGLFLDVEALAEQYDLFYAVTPMATILDFGS